jgi:hypothetical protein
MQEGPPAGRVWRRRDALGARLRQRAKPIGTGRRRGPGRRRSRGRRGLSGDVFRGCEDPGVPVLRVSTAQERWRQRMEQRAGILGSFLPPRHDRRRPPLGRDIRSLLGLVSAPVLPCVVQHDPDGVRLSVPRLHLRPPRPGHRRPGAERTAGAVGVCRRVRSLCLVSLTRRPATDFSPGEIAT